MHLDIVSYLPSVTRGIITAPLSLAVHECRSGCVCVHTFLCNCLTGYQTKGTFLFCFMNCVEFRKKFIKVWKGRTNNCLQISKLPLFSSGFYCSCLFLEAQLDPNSLFVGDLKQPSHPWSWSGLATPALSSSLSSSTSLPTYCHHSSPSLPASLTAIVSKLQVVVVVVVEDRRRQNIVCLLTGGLQAAAGGASIQTAVHSGDYGML